VRFDEITHAPSTYAARSAQRSSAWARTVFTASSWRSGG
jgi:hypothetical protein